MPSRLLTAEELMRLPDDGHRHELVRGELLTMSPAGPDHGWVAVKFGHFLCAHVLPRRLGRVFAADTGFLLARNPDTVRAPDGAFVGNERLYLIQKRGYFPGAPDCAVEVRSPNDSRRELADKARMWLAHGCALVVTVEPEKRTAIVYRPDAEPEPIGSDGTILFGVVVPGFELRMQDLFDG